MGSDVLGLHPAQKKQLLREELQVDLVWTEQQLHRRGLLEAANWLKLPRRLYSCRIRVTHKESVRDLMFVGLNDKVLRRPPRELMHFAGVAEIRFRHPPEAGSKWRHVELEGREAGVWPDAEIIAEDSLMDTAVEFDAGYPPKIIAKKFLAFDAAKFRTIIWGTTIQQRTQSVAGIALALADNKKFAHVQEVKVFHVDFASDLDPYRRRPRCHKWTSVSLDCTSGKVRGQF